MKMNKEFINQCLHVYVSFMTTGFILCKTEITDLKILLIGFFLGLLVEIYQYYFQDNKKLKIKDRILDVSFYVVGSFLLWVI